jgi:hypothetical protein
MTPASGQIIELLQLRGSLPCKTYLMVWHFESEQKTKTQQKNTHTNANKKLCWMLNRPAAAAYTQPRSAN